jgi:hypothetical protein
MNNDGENKQDKLKTSVKEKPKSSGNRSFRKLNKLGFYRHMQKKNKKESKSK